MTIFHKETIQNSVLGGAFCGVFSIGRLNVWSHITQNYTRFDVFGFPSHKSFYSEWYVGFVFVRTSYAKPVIDYDVVVALTRVTAVLSICSSS